MDRTVKLFYLWKLFEKKAFYPERDKIVGWLHCYGRFLDSLWKTGGYPIFDIKPSSKDVGGFFDYGPLSLKYYINLDLSLKKYHVSVELGGCDIQFSYDSKYFNELDVCEKEWPSSRDYKAELKKVKEKDIENILMGKVAHPAIHQHIKYKRVPHYIRIGISNKNPFFFLYQLAFQLCDCFQDFKDSDLKKKEFRRMKKLFFEYINKPDLKKGYFPIAPGTLFKL